MLTCNSINNTLAGFHSTQARVPRTFRPKYIGTQLISTSLISLNRKREVIYIPKLNCKRRICASMTTEIEPLGLEDDASLLEHFSKIPSIGKVWMVPSGSDVKVSMELSQKDVPQNSNRKYLVNFILNKKAVHDKEADTFVALEMPDVIYTSPSPSRKKVFVAKMSENKKETIIQIWNRASVEYELIIPEKLHGPMVNDGWFGNRASWSHDESLVAYVAEVCVVEYVLILFQTKPMIRRNWKMP